MSEIEKCENCAFWLLSRGKKLNIFLNFIQGDTRKKGELLKNQTKIEEIQQKKIIDRN